jgi:TRAP transporter TAXI family solute receptor
MSLRVPVRAPARRTVLRALAATGVLASASVAYAIGTDEPEPYRGGPVSISTGVPEGVYHRYGELLAPRLSADLGTRVTLESSMGSVENLRRVLEGRSTFGIATADAVADLPAGDLGRLAGVARLYDDYVQLVVPASSPVRRVEDLRGLRVCVGPPASGVELVTARVLRAAGMAPDADVTPARSGIGEAVAGLRAGELDAFFWSGGLPTVAVQALADELPIRLVPLGEIAGRLRSSFGTVYREAVIPADAYRHGTGVATEVATVAVPNLLVTLAQAPRRLVRRVTGTVMERRGAIGREVHAAQLVDPRTAVHTDPLALHEGARAWYRSQKP